MLFNKQEFRHLVNAYSKQDFFLKYPTNEN
jgi:hypothetical protein